MDILLNKTIYRRLSTLFNKIGELFDIEEFDRTDDTTSFGFSVDLRTDQGLYNLEFYRVVKSPFKILDFTDKLEVSDYVLKYTDKSNHTVLFTLNFNVGRNRSLRVETENLTMKEVYEHFLEIEKVIDAELSDVSVLENKFCGVL